VTAARAALRLAGIAAFVLLHPVGAVAEIDLDGPNSEDVAAHLTRDPSLPLVGLWKTDCADGFGLAIDRAAPGLYSISFCGPGGCFTPGSYRPNSPIVSDPAYRVLDPNRIQVRGFDGFSDYSRCE